MGYCAVGVAAVGAGFGVSVGVSVGVGVTVVVGVTVDITVTVGGSTHDSTHPRRAVRAGDWLVGDFKTNFYGGTCRVSWSPFPLLQPNRLDRGNFEVLEVLKYPLLVDVNEIKRENKKEQTNTLFVRTGTSS